ncbi:MAG TPA: DUF2339 domain-containing protein [Burkholderiales bacterium]|nr:DUF2339 domain-containing protein [Burkholderiales bacterium]
MWIIGLLLGLVIGGGTHGFEGAILGALVGWAVGYGMGQLIRSHDAKVDRSRLESRLEAVERAVRGLEQRLSSLEPEPTAQLPAQPAPHMVDSAPSEPTQAPAHAAAAPPAPPQTPSGSGSPGAPQAATLAPRRPKAVREPSALWRWVMGGNTVARIGVVVLFFGVAFLLKYAYEHTQIPISVRLTGVAISAIVLLAIGWRLRIKRPGYALALQGAGVGVLYLTVFAALRLYQLLPPEAALVLLFLIAALSAALAVMQDAQSLAALGASGGFLAPILASTGGGSHVMLFSYYTMLNLGILGVAWYRAWRPLNLLGFLFTFAIGTLWGTRFYQPELFQSTEPFLILFFLLYLAIPILFARQRARPVAALGEQQVQNYVDATLVFGTPLVAFALQTRLVREIEYGSAFSAAALSLVYLVLARWLYARQRGELRLLVEAFLALGVVFGTLTIPLALDGRWTSAGWALEGAAILWAGVRQRRWVARAFGMFLQLAAGAAFVTTIDRGYGSVPVLNSFYLGCVLIAVAGLFCHWYVDRNRERLRGWEPAVASALFVWGLVWWAAGALHEIWRWVAGDDQNHAWLLFAAASCVLFSVLWRALHWRMARIPALALLPLMILAATTDAAEAHQPLAHIGWLAWPAAFGAHLWLLRRHEESASGYTRFLHAAGLWLFVGLASWQLEWTTDQLIAGGAAWSTIAWAVVPGIVLGLLATRGERMAWPVRGRVATYALLGAAPLAVLLLAWTVVVNFISDGDASPLPYVPLLNPLDLAQVAAVLAVVLWLRWVDKLHLGDYFGDTPGLTYGALGLVAFVALNGMVLRALHHWAGVPFVLDTLLESMLVQAALSIFWTVLALCAMVVASRLRVRALWIVGASLMGVVVLKLFLVDLSNVGGVERIVSFIGVGVLMLLVGYLSPVPPKTQEGTQ